MPEPSPPPTSSGEPRGADCGSAGGAVLPLVPGFERRPAKQRPLPDAVAVRLLGVPDSAPPYDDSPGAAARPPGRGTAASACPVARAAQGAQGAIGTDRGARPSDAGRAGQAAPAIRAPPAAAQTRPVAEPVRPGPGGDAGGIAAPGQIRPWTSEQARRRIRQLGPRLAADVQPRVRRIMTSRPAAGVVEMTVIVGFGPRIRVLAVRLERDEPPQPEAGPYRGRGHGPGATARWTCTAIEAA